MASAQRELLFLVTEDWYFVSHRLALARAARVAGYRVVVATRVGECREALAAAGCEIVSVDWTRGVGNPITEFRLLLRVLQLYRRRRPSIVHHVALKPVVYGSIAAVVAGVPHVVNAIAGLGYLFTNAGGRARFFRPIVRAALRTLLNRSGTWVIVQNRDDRELLEREAGLEPPRSVLMRGAGVDVGEFPYSPVPEGVPLVLLPARLLWDKGIGEFVEAARRLRAEGAEARFAIVGGLDPANPRAIDRKTVEGWVQADDIEWWGHRREMAGVYLQASIVCLPSYREGLPKVLLEAAATGRPIVTTDVPGCREVVTDGVNGLLVEARNPTALANALRALLQDRAARERMGRMGRARAEAEFGIERVISQTLPLYLHPAP